MPVNPNPAPEPAKEPNPGVSFNAEDFAKTLLAEMDKRTNAMDKRFNTLLEKLEATKPEPKPAVEPKPAEGDPNPEPKEARTIAELNVELKRQQKQVENATKAIQEWQDKANKAEAARLDSERNSAIDKILSDIPFASSRARQQFRDAYAHKVERDEDGALIVKTDKGPLAFDTYLTAEAEDSPHFLAPTGQGGAGAAGGKRAFGGPKLDITTMSVTEIAKLAPEQRAAAWADVVDVLPR